MENSTTSEAILAMGNNNNRCHHSTPNTMNARMDDTWYFHVQFQKRSYYLISVCDGSLLLTADIYFNSWTAFHGKNTYVNNHNTHFYWIEKLEKQFIDDLLISSNESQLQRNMRSVDANLKEKKNPPAIAVVNYTIAWRINSMNRGLTLPPKFLMWSVKHTKKKRQIEQICWRISNFCHWIVLSFYRLLETWSYFVAILSCKWRGLFIDHVRVNKLFERWEQRTQN